MAAPDTPSGAYKDVDDTLARRRRLGATRGDEVVEYEIVDRRCDIRGPEGILIGLAQSLARASATRSTS